jgi:dihydroorotate dehydrogenase (fumarate)
MSIDLTTNYGGLMLKSPIVVGACPMMAQEQARLAVESAGAGAIVLPSLFDEHVKDWILSAQARALGEHTTQADPRWHDGSAYLSFVNRASTQSSIPIIASLNGHKADRWVDYADELEEAGAGAIELSIHHGSVRDFEDPRAIEQQIVTAIREISASLTIPVFVKLSQHYTSVSHLAQELQSGTQGLVLFGRRPNVDVSLDDFRLKSEWGLTSSGSITESLATIMEVHSFCPSMPLAACGGIGNACDVAKAILAGADVAMVTSALYREGVDVIRQLVDGLRQFMKANQMRTMQDLVMHRPLQFATDQERANYIKALSSRPTLEHTQR